MTASASLGRFPSFRARTLFSVTVVLLTCSMGCQSNCDLVEAELRAKESQMDQLRQELNHQDCEITALEVELEQLQRRCYKPKGDATGSCLVAQSLTLGRLTGGYDKEPCCPGDEALQVVVEPRDCDDQSVKAPGALHIDVYEITQQGMKVPLSNWDLTPRELRKTWNAPLLGGPAYRVTLPWKAIPCTEKLRVVAQFTAPDGARFEADRDVTVRLPEHPRRRAERRVVPHDESEPLHMPRHGPPETDVPGSPPKSPIIEAPRVPNQGANAPRSPSNLVPPSPPTVEVNTVNYRPSVSPAAPAPARAVGLSAPINARPRR